MKFRLFTFILFFAFTATVQAQSIADEVQLIQAAFGMEKRAVVQEYMKLSGDKAAAFWSVYDQYEEARRANGRDYINIVNDYLAKYESLSDVDATSIAKRILKNEADMNKLQGNYLGKFTKVAGAQEAVKFLQLERYIQNNVRMAISDAVPFLGEK